MRKTLFQIMDGLIKRSPVDDPVCGLQLPDFLCRKQERLSGKNQNRCPCEALYAASRREAASPAPGNQKPPCCGVCDRVSAEHLFGKMHKAGREHRRRKKCRKKAGGRKRPPVGRTSPRRAGRGLLPGGRKFPVLLSEVVERDQEQAVSTVKAIF